MKVPLNWLTKHLQTDASDENIITRLTSLGLVVDGVTAPGKAFDGFIVARIASAAPHPQADRLQVCQVETGAETLQIVCGAPNARAGLTVVLATEGAVVPSNQMVIGKAVMRGVESRGMLCSAAELGLEGDTQGIIELEEGIPLGTPFAQYMGLDTLILDVDVTPNRGDCLSLRGMARDLAASGVGALAMLQIKVIPATTTETLPVTLSPVAEIEACPLFMGRVIKGVKNGPSPQWLQNALRTVGIRSISALVDVTNYMAFDLGRPMHVFDTARLKGGLNVRLSEDGEQLDALDDKTYTLPKGLPVIADDAGLVSLAGIMGGKTSGCSLETTDVFLESAYFIPRAIARAGQATGIFSESRARFERGVDKGLVQTGLERATQLILELCGGDAGPVIHVGDTKTSPHMIKFAPSSVEKRTGLCVDVPEMTELLERLGCMVTPLEDDLLTVMCPTWRHDFVIQDDLIEEIVRLKGYDMIPATPLPKGERARDFFESAPGSHLRMRREWIARRVLAARGMAETLGWSFVAEEEATLFAEGAPLYSLDNPISQDLSVMRPRVLPSLILTAARNVAKGLLNPALFEVASHYEGIGAQDQKRMVAGVRLGQTGMRHWREKPQNVSWTEVKADVWTLLEACGVEMDHVQLESKGPSFYHPGRVASVFVSGQLVAVFGALHPKILKAFNVKGSLVAFEVFLDHLPGESASKDALALSPFQTVARDLAFVLDQKVPADAVIRLVKETDPLIHHVTIFDVYEGVGIPDGKKSLALTYEMAPFQATLTDADLHDIMDRVIARVETATGGVLRA